MDLLTKTSFSQALSPITTPSNSILGSHFHSSDSSFPIIAIAILGILATAFLLLSYYIFVIKCWLNRSRIGLGTRQREDPLMIYSPAMENNHRGLDESVIRKIPIFQFKIKDSKVIECAVCLNEFQDNERLRMIPNCSHVFHIDCIDVWLQNNANCPLCRTSVSSNDGRLLPQDPNLIIHGDEEFVVIELGGGTNSSDQTLLGGQERLNSGELSTRSISTSPLKLHKKARKFHKGTSMGDECIDIRDQDEQFAIQPIRRSISMDSSADRRLYFAVQEAIRLNRGRQVSPIEGCSSSSSRMRSFFSFGHSRGSKTAILPVSLKPES